MALHTQPPRLKEGLCQAYLTPRYWGAGSLPEPRHSLSLSVRPPFPGRSTPACLGPFPELPAFPLGSLTLRRGTLCPHPRSYWVLASRPTTDVQALSSCPRVLVHPVP